VHPCPGGARPLEPRAERGRAQHDEPGHVAIRLSLVDSGRRFELLVEDDGPGLPEETLASLQSETFLVDDARPRGPEMGMLITTEVARRAGWSMSYEALEPHGLQVRLEGPVVRPGGPEPTT
jgi:signal transduction histidine kinase